MKYTICEHCNRKISLSNYTRHVRSCVSTHKETYHLDHDDLLCKFCGKECKNRNSLVQHEIRCKYNENALVIDYRREGFNVKGRKAWNKGLTKDTSASIAKAAESFSLSYKQGKHKPRINKMVDPIVKAKHKAKMQEVYSKYHKGHTKGFKQGYYKGVWCDSSWELAYLVYLFDHNIPVCRNTIGFKYLTLDGNTHTYFPDFYLCSCQYFVEIKGYMREVDMLKLNQFPHPILVLQEKEMIPVLQYAVHKYGDNFTSLYDMDNQGASP